MTDPRPLVLFLDAGTAQTSICEVGGKAYSLLRMTEAGLRVPFGAVLTTEFFAPWMDEVRKSPVWATFADADPAAWPELCSDLERIAGKLTLSALQRHAVEDLRVRLAPADEAALFAVRSSSPEEDLASASFAGGYETRLGVPPRELEPALRHCFASALDHRVFVYKQEHGLDVLSPRIAVLVQQQIDSEIAGVAFSLNPLTNDYDEAVVDANWGLGESVVAGLASPDHFVVDKVSGEVLEQQLGAKQLSIWLAEGGGTLERRGFRADEPTLDEQQLGELSRTLGRIESLCGHPTDLEWAWAEDRLYVLQARPITAWVPLPTEMLTEPGERRRLYADSALSQGLTINEPISPLGLAWLQEMLYRRLLEGRLGIADFTPTGGLVFAAGCRFYMNLSNIFWMRISAKTMARGSADTDALLAEILANVDGKRYRAVRRPPWLRPRLLLRLPGVLWALRRALWFPLEAMLSPERAWRDYQERLQVVDAELARSLEDDRPLAELAEKYTGVVERALLEVTLPALFAGLASPGMLVPRWSRAGKAVAAGVRQGLPGNVVVEQGIALYRLAQSLDPAELDDIDRLATRIEQRRLPSGFLVDWDAFMDRFGCRGPLEMDPASPRYGDDPRVALRQMSFMRASTDAAEAGFDPQASHDRNIDRRRQAVAELSRRFGPLRRALLRRIHRVLELFGGTRDTPKHHVVMLTWAIRRRALKEGQRLVREGRLDHVDDIFGLTFDDLEEATEDSALDLRARCAERMHFAAQLATHVTEFPQIIDSRGRIPRPPPRQSEPGELVGTAVSPGIVTGPVKVLRNPRQKTIERGEVLVAYTTDPGWTPLFVNAAAVVLEVGGVLQHGAVIAREYGKPCVVGVDRVVSKLQDGQIVEVDGGAGVVRVQQ